MDLWHRLVLVPLLVGVLLVVAPSGGDLGAQPVERERQLPVAPERDVLEITPALRGALELFEEIEGFRVARLLVRDDGQMVLEVEYVLDDQLHRERRFLSEGALEELRGRVAVHVAEADVSVGIDWDGRGGLVLGQTLLGLGFHGWAVPVVLDLDSSQAIVAAYLLTAGASFYLPYRFSRTRPVSEVDRDLTMYGATRGILAGALTGDILADQGSDATGRIRLGGGLLASWGGAALGYAAARRFAPDEGSTALWGALGDFGFAAGAAAAFAAGPYDSRDEAQTVNGFEVIESRTRNRPLGHAITLAGGGGGLVAGRWLAQRESYTEGNVSVLRSGGILGAQAGLTLARSATDNDRALVAGALAGGLGGLVGTNRLVRGRAFSNGEGLLVNAGHVAGAATALGITYLAVEEIDEHPLLYLAAATSGSLLGAGLVFRAVEGGSGPAASSGGAARERPGSGATISVHPENFLLGVIGRARVGTLAPVATIRF